MRISASAVLILSAAVSLFAQNSTLRGVVTDESGAVVPAAAVTLTGSDGVERTAAADARGAYIFPSVPPGDYTLQASAPQLVLRQPQAVTLRGVAQTVNVRLSVASTVQEIVVEENAGPAVSTDAANNAAAVVMRGEDLAALADNPEDLQTDLEALAGPSAGPGGGSIYIDGFSSGDIPPKESIREVRINQNPFSPEFDKLGLGRIEILTKPGADKYHAALNYNFADDFWNARNPYSAQKAPLLLHEWENNLGGPINKRTSFTLDANQNNVDNGSIVNAVVLDPQLAENPLLNNFRTIQRRTRVSPRIDYQLNENNTLTFRYDVTRGDIQGAGIGGFNLTPSGYHIHYLSQTAQAIETTVHGTTVNETRFQYHRHAAEYAANSASPALQVLGAFNAGGSPIGQYFDTTNNFELQNNTTAIHGAHTWRFGLRARGLTDENISPQNFNGTFTFSSLDRFRDTLQLQRQGFSPAQVVAQGGGATQFSISEGTRELGVDQFDVGLFAGDDWRLRPNLTLNLGVRYEAQTNMHDWSDLAPRLGFAWAPGARNSKAQAKTVVRGGFGIFYDRFAIYNKLTAERFNGIVQTQYVIPNPNFLPNCDLLECPLPDNLTTVLKASQFPQLIQQIAPGVRAPYTMQAALTLERQLPKGTTLALTYTNSRALRLLRSQDINAPYNPAGSGSDNFPLGNPNPVFQMETNGAYKQNQFVANVNSKVSQTISLFGTYVFNRSMSNTDGISTFPANPYSLAGEYGPAGNDIHHRLNVGGSINTKWNVRLSPLVTLQTGAPFNITTGSDLYGTTLFNARPGIAADPELKDYHGLFLDPNPGPGEALLPRNFGRGPGQMMVNLRVAKTFGFGTERKSAKAGGLFAAPSERRYSLIVAMAFRNILNHTNPGPIIGDIASPFFGRANQMAGGSNGEGFSENANNRRLELQTRFTF